MSLTYKTACVVGETYFRIAQARNNWQETTGGIKDLQQKIQDSG